MRQKRYLEQNVYDAAKDRIRKIYDLFDSVVVCWSGGKDSTACLWLVWEVAQELGKTHVDVLFRDEEVIPDCIVNFVDEYRRKDWVRLNWFAIPLESTKFILGQSVKYVQWEPGRKHFRPVPEWAITLPEGDDRVFSQVDADAFLSQWYKGKTAFVLGIRAAESLTRFRSCVNKLNLNYINKSSSKNVSLCKPIYDWEENDVFKYFYEKEIRYVELYDWQNLAGRPLRVSTPFHAESAKMIGKLREIDPQFYERCMEFMPEMRIQERYWRDMDRRKLKDEASKSFASIMGYIDETFDDPMVKEKAMIFLEEARRLHVNSPAGYPLKYIFTYVLNGNFKRTMIPMRPDDQHPPSLAPDAHVKIRDKAYAKQEIKLCISDQPPPPTTP